MGVAAGGGAGRPDVGTGAGATTTVGAEEGAGTVVSNEAGAAAGGVPAASSALRGRSTGVRANRPSSAQRTSVDISATARSRS